MPQAALPGEATRHARSVTLAALAATLVGVGLARFAYSPLIPALIGAGWFSAAATVQLGAANLAGYLAGALLAGRMAALAPPHRILRANMLVATLSFLACAVPLSFAWYFVWRFASGLAGGVLMALAAPVVLPQIPPDRRGFASGVIFTGIGLGIAASGTLVPALLRAGPRAAWLGLGVLALLLTLAAWNAWPRGPALPAQAHLRWRARLALRATWASYALNGIGLVPPIVFLVDFIARGLGHGIPTGAAYWVVYGLGALAGPVLAGTAADRLGFRRAYPAALLLQAVFVALPAFTHAMPALAAAAAIIGAMTPGIVPVVMGRTHMLAPPDPAARRAAWRMTIISFAAGQAAGGYLFAFLFARTGSYALLFALGGAALLFGWALHEAGARLDSNEEPA